MYFSLIARFIFSILKPLVVGIISILGLGIFTYTGINYGLDFLKEYIMSGFGSATPQLKQILALAKVDIAINLILTAATMKFLLMGISSTGKLKKYTLGSK